MVNDDKTYSISSHERFNINEPHSKYGLDEFQLYQTAREYRRKIYPVIKSLPVQEKYALDPQMRKAIISVTNNIAEGHGRWHFRETIQFCRIARGSTEEIIDDLNVCIDENYFQEDKCKDLKKLGYELIKQINGYIAYLRNNQKQNTKTNNQ